MKSGDKLEIIGYGHLAGERRTARLVATEAMRVILSVNDPEDGREYELAFRKSDGVVFKGELSGGYVIPEVFLKQLKGIAAPAAKPSSGKPRAGKSSAVQPVSVSAAGESTATMETAAVAPETPVKPRAKATAPKAAAAPAASNGKAKTSAKPAAKKETKAEAPAATMAAAVPGAVGKNGKTPAATPATPAVKPKSAAAPKPAAAPATPAAKPAAPSKPKGELSPMEIERRTPGGDEVEVNLSPLIYRQLCWDEIRGQDGRKTPGFASFRKAMESAAERSYVFVVLGETAARFLVNVALLGGFYRWEGSMAGGFKRQAKRTAEQVAAKFPSIPVPSAIAAYGGDPVPGKAKPGRPRKVQEEAAAPPAAVKPKTASKPAAKPKAAAPTPAAAPPVAARPKVRPKVAAKS